MDKTPRRAGWTFLASALILAGSVFAILWQANDAPHIKAPGERYVIENDERLLVVDPIHLQPGLGVSLPGWLMTKYSRAHGDVEFLLVAQGDAARILAGQSPTKTYHREAPSRGFPPTVTVWPDAGIAQVEAVWVAPAATVSALDRQAIAQNARNTQDDIYLVDPALAPMLGPLIAVVGLAATATIAAGIWWFREARTPTLPRDAGDTEALVHLVALGAHHLERMATVLRLTAGLLAFSGIVGAWTLFNMVWASSGSIDFDRHMPWLVLAIFGGAALAYAGAWAVWARHYVDVRRELARWRDRARAPPAQLVG